MSIIQDTCYDDIIGLSRSSCQCFNYPSNVSNSGLYLDELEPLNSSLVWGEENCEKGSLVDIMTQARAEAVKIFKAEIIQSLLKTNQVKRVMFKGSIGNANYQNNLFLSAPYAGIRMLCADVRSGIIHITSIKTLFAENGTFDLKIYNKLNELIQTVSITSEANKIHNNVVDITLPLHNDLLNNIEYYFLYDSPGRNPKDCQVACCGKYTWSEQVPGFTKARTGWEAWVMVGSLQVSNLNFQGQYWTPFVPSNTYLNGLLLGVEFKCNINEVVCKDAFDFDNNPMAISVALAIRYKAGELLINSIFGIPNINRYVLMNRETLASARLMFIGEYQKLLAYLSENIPVNTNDCLECYDAWGIVKTGIFS